MKRIFSAAEIKGKKEDEQLLDGEEFKRRMERAKDILIKRNKIVSSKNIPAHLKAYVHALKTGF